MSDAPPSGADLAAAFLRSARARGSDGEMVAISAQHLAHWFDSAIETGKVVADNERRRESEVDWIYSKSAHEGYNMVAIRADSIDAIAECQGADPPATDVLVGSQWIVLAEDFTDVATREALR